MNLQAAMRQATKEILSDPRAKVFWDGEPRRLQNSYDINCGSCEDWANRVGELVGNEVDVIGPEDISDDPNDWFLGHVFIRYHDKYYDSECPTGVKDWKRLPFFVRQPVAV